MITQKQARQEALKRASGAIQAYIDGGSVWEAYEHLPTEDIEHIAAEVKKILSSLVDKIDITSTVDLSCKEARGVN